MEKDHYINLKKQIEYYLPEIKYIALWNNQFARSNGTRTDERKEHAFNYPCVFIQYHSPEFRQLSLGIQEFDIEITSHLGFKSLLTEDTKILELKEKLYYVMQRFQSDNWARLSRVNEEWDFDHDNVSVLKTQYHTRGMDDFRYVFAGQDLTSITGLTISATTVTLSGLSIGNLTGSTNVNGNNEFDPANDTFDNDEDGI